METSEGLLLNNNSFQALAYGLDGTSQLTTDGLILSSNNSMGGLVYGTYSPTQLFTNPLDPLTAEEITTAVGIVKQTQNLSDSALFPSVNLFEPDKADVLAYTPGSVIDREAKIVVLEREQNKVFEGVVDLNAGQLTSWQEIPGVQPNLTEPEEREIVSSVVKADPRWQEAMRERGISNFDDIVVSGSAPGNLTASERASGVRLIRGLSYLQTGDNNYYAHPIEGVLATVNLNTKEVINFIDTGVVPISTDNAGLDEVSIGNVRNPLRPLEINQPEGASFQIQGNQIKWDNWNFHYRMDPRTGLVLDQVSYNDNGTVRPILYRASLSEMAVPYADPSPTWNFRSSFDVGDYQLGRFSNTLQLGQQVPSNAVLLDSVFADDFGKAYVSEDTLGVYERDSGLLWQHYNSQTKSTEVRRGRELVLTQVATIGNYDYAFDWIFKQDGSIEVEVDLTGILWLKGTNATNASELDESDEYSPIVAPNVLGPNHQHFFNYRLDFDVDGLENSVEESNVQGLPISETNPLGNAFVETETLLTGEQNATRNLNMQTSRHWAVINATKENALGGEIGYTLEPENNTVPYAATESYIRQRAGFVNNHVWVTQYKPEELYAAGDYPNQGQPGQGLPTYVSDDQSLVGEDVVLWYTVGLTHITRPEDYPVMPVETVGFKILPTGFFTRNPALNVPKA
ncbi:primary-amine oxidase [Tolypothrix campylonemoides VB511288]|nr:primary-amine oxidase [Tolypothrix campylonemoides VB511288]